MERKDQFPDDNKLRELILYIADKSETDPTFGAIKLNKILFYSDFIMYWKTGNSITGHEYMKLGQGSAPRRLLPIQEKLIYNCEAALKQTDYYGYAQKRLLALRKPDLSMFTAEEIAEVDRVIEAFRDINGTLASEISHRFLGWKAAKYKETIPYSTAFFSDRELTEEEIRRGLNAATRVSK